MLPCYRVSPVLPLTNKSPFGNGYLGKISTFPLKLTCLLNYVSHKYLQEDVIIVCPRLPSTVSLMPQFFNAIVCTVAGIFIDKIWCKNRVIKAFTNIRLHNCSRCCLTIDLNTRSFTLVQVRQKSKDAAMWESRMFWLYVSFDAFEIATVCIGWNFIWDFGR